MVTMMLLLLLMMMMNRTHTKALPHR